MKVRRIDLIQKEWTSEGSRGAVLDNAIDEAAEVFKHNYGIEELGDPSVQSQVRPFLSFSIPNLMLPLS